MPQKDQKQPFNKKYSHLCPLGLCTGKFYGKVKVHKITSNDGAEHLLINPDISNTDRAK